MYRFNQLIRSNLHGFHISPVWPGLNIYWDLECPPVESKWHVKRGTKRRVARRFQVQRVLDPDEVVDLENHPPTPRIQPAKCQVCDSYHRTLWPIRISDTEQSVIHSAHEEPAPAEGVVQCPFSSYLLTQAGLPLASDGGEPLVVALEEVQRFTLWLMDSPYGNILDVYAFEAEYRDELVGSHPVVARVAYLLEAITVQLSRFFALLCKLEA